MTELERCLALLREIDHKAAKREVPFRFGTAYLHDELPRRLEPELPEPRAGPRIGDAPASSRRRPTGCSAKQVSPTARSRCSTPRSASGSLPGSRKLGWRVECDVVMVAAREPDRETDLSVVEEVGRGRARADLGRGTGHGRRCRRRRRDPAAGRGQARARDCRSAHGSSPREPTARSARYCELYSRSGTGQIENVLTLERFRNRGLARALVLRTLEELARCGKRPHVPARRPRRLAEGALPQARFRRDRLRLRLRGASPTS